MQLKNIEEFHNITGLQPIVQAFNRAGLTVDKIFGDPKPKRQSGFLMKSSTITFKSGQKLEMRLNLNGGNIFQWRLNGKVLAIKNYKILDEAMKEVINFVLENERAYLARQAASKIQRVTTPKLPTATMTLDEQMQTYKNKLVELEAEKNIIRQHIATQESISAEKRGTLTLLERKIDAENHKSLALEAELESLKKSVPINSRKTDAIFESATPTTGPVIISPLAGFDVSGPPQKITVDIDGDLKEPVEYRGIIQAIELARGIDRITLRINSSGGNLQAAQALYAALLKTQAHTKAEIISALSIGAVVAMSCDSVKLTPFCSMMINYASSGSGGKLGDIASFATFKNDHLTAWYAELFSGFLTEKELKDISKGQDFWLKEDQIRERLKNWKPIRERVRRDGSLEAA